MNNDKKTNRVLMGLAVVGVVGAVVLGVTLVVAREHPPQGPATDDTLTAVPTVNLAAILPTAAELPDGYSPPPENVIPAPSFTVATQQPGAPEPEPCAAGGGNTLPNQPSAAESPAQLLLFGPVAASQYMTLIAMHMGAWKDLSPVRTVLADCADSHSDGMSCSTREYKPSPPLTDTQADDAIATESTCTALNNSELHNIVYFGAVGDVLVYVMGSGHDSRPMQNAFTLMVRKARNLQK